MYNQFACPPGETGDGYIGNHPDPDMGWPSGGCDYVYWKDTLIEFGEGLCGCSATVSSDSFEIGKCVEHSGGLYHCVGGIYNNSGVYGYLGDGTNGESCAQIQVCDGLGSEPFGTICATVGAQSNCGSGGTCLGGT